MADTAYPYDIKFTVGATTYGFMLVSPKGESKQIKFVEAGAPSAERVSTSDIASHQDYAPMFDTPFAMGSFVGGVGQLFYEEGEEDAYLWSDGIVTHTTGKAYLAPNVNTLTLTGATGDITCFRTYMTSANVRYDFLVESTNIWRRTATDNTTVWTKVYTASVTITDFQIIQGIGLICVPTLAGATDFYTQADVTAAATWTPTARDHTLLSDALGKPSYFQVVRGTTYALISKRKVLYTTDPTVDGWVGPIDTSLTGNISGPPGDDTYLFSGSHSVGDYLFTIRPDLICSIDSAQDVAEVIWEWKDKPSDYNFKYYASGSDKFIYAVGPEVYVYEPQTGMAKPTMLSRKSGFSTKEILGLAADNQYIYVLAKVRVPSIRTADSVALLRGSRMASGWTFEVLWEDTSLSGKTYGRLAAFPFGADTRLYWGQNNASDTLTYVMSLPANWDESTSANYKSSATLYTSFNRSGFLGFNKRHLYINADSTDTDATNTIAVKYSLDRGATYTTLGTSTSTEYSGNYVDKYSKEIGLAFTLTSAANVTTPTLRNFDHHQRVRFKYLKAGTASIRIARNIALRNDSTQSLAPDTVWGFLETMRTTNSRIQYTDFMGNSFDVSVDMIGVNPTRHENPGEYELEALIVFTEADRGS